VELASQWGGPYDTLIRAESGPFGSVNSDPGLKTNFWLKPQTIVWAVTFEHTAVECPLPDNGVVGTCWPPVKGTLTVFLDYHTGAFLVTAGRY
jgi:hypothetical protein